MRSVSPSVSPARSSYDALVDLNVQGTKITVRRDVVTRYPDTHLARWIVGTEVPLRDRKDRVFVDVNPSTFRDLYAMMRDGEMPSAWNGANLYEVARELDGLGFGALLRHTDAVQKAVIACDADPENLALQYALSDAYHAAGETYASWDTFHRAMFHDQYRYGRVAIEHYEAALESNPKNGFALARRAQAHIEAKIGHVGDDLIAMAREAVEQAPNIVDGYRALAEALGRCSWEASTPFDAADLVRGNELLRRLIPRAREGGADAVALEKLRGYLDRTNDFRMALHSMQFDNSIALEPLGDALESAYRASPGASREQREFYLANEFYLRLNYDSRRGEALSTLRRGIDHVPQSAHLRNLLAQSLLSRHCQALEETAPVKGAGTLRPLHGPWLDEAADVLEALVQAPDMLGAMAMDLASSLELTVRDGDVDDAVKPAFKRIGRVLADYLGAACRKFREEQTDSDEDGDSYDSDDEEGGIDGYGLVARMERLATEGC